MGKTFAGPGWAGRWCGLGRKALLFAPFSLALTLADVGIAWAAPPYHQTVEVEVTGVRFHGLGDGIQSAEVSINGELSAQLPLTACGFVQNCPTQPVDRTTCGPGVSTDPPVTPASASFLIDVPVGGARCDWIKPEVIGHINHYHTYALGGPTFIAADGFIVDLKAAAPVETCFFQDGLPANENRPSGLTYTIRADAMGDRVDSDADGFADEDEIWGTDVDCDGVTDGVTHLSVALGGYHDVPTNPSVPDSTSRSIGWTAPCRARARPSRAA